MGKVTFLYYLLFKGNHVLEATCDKKTSNVTFLILFLNKLDSMPELKWPGVPMLLPQ